MSLLSILMVPAYGVAAVIKLKGHQYEHFITRVIIGVVYGYFCFIDDVPPTLLLIVQWAFLLLAIIEITSYLTMRFGCRKG